MVQKIFDVFFKGQVLLTVPQRNFQLITGKRSEGSSFFQCRMQTLSCLNRISSADVFLIATLRMKTRQLLINNWYLFFQKQPSRGVLRKRCSENIQQIYRSNFIEIGLRHGCSPVNLLHVFRIPFPKNTYEGLLLHLFFQKYLVLPSMQDLSIKLMDSQLGTLYPERPTS